MIAELEVKVKVTLFDYQVQFMEAAKQHPVRFRACLFFKTGAGKSLTALAGLAALGHTKCLVIAPPSTHKQWWDLGRKMNITVEVMSHAMFRQTGTKVSRTVPIIADEFHLFGGQQGKGWRKLDKIALHLEAPLILCSATPNYNDAERCYCVQHILHPGNTKGGFLQFIYQHCTTEQNPFGMLPIVTGFHKYPDAAAFLADMDGVYYIPDDAVFTIDDVPYTPELHPALEEWGYDERNHKMIASGIELRHTVRFQGLVSEQGWLHPHITKTLLGYFDAGPVMIFAAHATVAEATQTALHQRNRDAALVTGQTSKAEKEQIIQEFRDGRHPILIGTSTLATGTDGLDKVCDTLIILDDTDDDALRRQLVGRILPRGAASQSQQKKIVRLVPSP